MNFIKSLKFSVKGIDTTRYISRALARGISSVKSKGLKDPLRTPPKVEKHFRRSLEGVMSTPSIERGDPSLRSG